MDWIIKNLPIVLSSGAILIVLFVLKRALDWAEWKGGADKTITSLEKTLQEIKKDIRSIQDDIKKIFGRLLPDTVQGGSPLTLTDKGRVISQELEIVSWAESTAEGLAESMLGKQPYEVQTFCFEYVRGDGFDPSDELLRAIKDCAYNHATTVDSVIDVFAIELRDVLLVLQGGE